ncbi:MAG: hypothetical protein ABIV25_05575 [Paracoccaceae bacterium]
MKTSFAIEDTKPLVSIQALISRHGAIVIGLAYLRAALAIRKHPPNADEIWISDHLRRDIGLQPKSGPMRGNERHRYGGIE